MSKNPTKIGERGLALVKEFEGFYSKPYWDRPMPDPRAVRTIGYGTTRINGRPVKSSDHLTEKAASKLLEKQINNTAYAGALTRTLDSLGRKLNQNEYDALLSAVYNLGPGILSRGRSLGDALRSKKWRTNSVKALPLYSEPGSNVHAGLLRRRKAEIKLFKSEAEPKDRLVALGYTKNEIKWIRNFDSWFRRKVNPTGRKRLRNEMRKQRKRIWRVAQPKSKGGDGKGWTQARRARYKSLLSRSR